MGLHRKILQFLAGMHRHQPWPEPLLTLGVQDIYASYEDAQELIRSEGITPRDVPRSQQQQSTSLMFRNWGGDTKSFVHSRTFFNMLGLDRVSELDLSDKEQPALIHDLNQPIPMSWHQAWGTVLDSGTVEHLFDVRTAFSNIASLVRVGGTVLHVSPMSGWVNHGFFQLSPCLFFDFYQSNGFQPLDAILVSSSDARFQNVKFFPYKYTTGTLTMKFPTDRYLLIFRAQKVQHVWPTRVPTQQRYVSRMSA